MKNRTSRQQGRTVGGVGSSQPPGGQRLMVGAGVGGSIGVANLSKTFGSGLSDPVTWSWIWFGVALAIVVGFPFVFKAGPVDLEL